uniref:VWFA domain-containing protein n=1 Tax=Macrostomum lignano TaxID=282301 RepID=A0A1I8IIW0_9PLAT
MPSRRCSPRRLLGSTSLSLALLALLCCSAASGADDKDDKCHQRLDVVVCVDASSSSNAAEFEKLKPFLRQLPSRFKVSQTKTRMALVTYAQHARLVLDFNDTVTAEDFVNAVNRLEFVGGKTDFEAPVKLVWDRLLPQLRPKQAMFNLMLVMDGRQEDILDKYPEPNALSMANARQHVFRMKMKRIGFHVIGIGSPWHRRLLFTMQGFNCRLSLGIDKAFEVSRALNYRRVCGDCRFLKTSKYTGPCMDGVRYSYESKISKDFTLPTPMRCRINLSRKVESCNMTSTCQSKAPADIALVLDITRSEAADFQKLKDAAKAIVGFFDIGRSDSPVKVAIFTFYSFNKAYQILSLSQKKTKAEILAIIDGINMASEDIRANRESYPAIEMAVNHLKNGYSSKSHKNNHLVLLTSGNSNLIRSKVKVYEVLAEQSITAYAIGVTRESHRVLTAPESDSNAFLIPDHSSFVSTAQKLAGALCVQMEPSPKLCEEKVVRQQYGDGGCLFKNILKFRIEFKFDAAKKCTKKKTFEHREDCKNVATSPFSGVQYLPVDKPRHCFKYEKSFFPTKKFLPTMKLDKCVATDYSCVAVGQKLSCRDEYGNLSTNCKCDSHSQGTTLVIEPHGDGGSRPELVRGARLRPYLLEIFEHARAVICNDVQRRVWSEELRPDVCVCRALDHEAFEVLLGFTACRAGRGWLQTDAVAITAEAGAVAGAEVHGGRRCDTGVPALDRGMVTECKLLIQVNAKQFWMQFEGGLGVAEHDAWLHLSISLARVGGEIRDNRLGSAEVHLPGLGPQQEPIGSTLQSLLALADGCSLSSRGAVAGVSYDSTAPFQSSSFFIIGRGTPSCMAAVALPRRSPCPVNSGGDKPADVHSERSRLSNLLAVRGNHPVDDHGENSSQSHSETMFDAARSHHRLSCSDCVVIFACRSIPHQAARTAAQNAMSLFRRWSRWACSLRRSAIMNGSLERCCRLRHRRRPRSTSLTIGDSHGSGRPRALKYSETALAYAWQLRKADSWVDSSAMYSATRIGSARAGVRCRELQKRSQDASCDRLIDDRDSSDHPRRQELSEMSSDDRRATAGDRRAAGETYGTGDLDRELLEAEKQLRLLTIRRDQARMEAEIRQLGGRVDEPPRRPLNVAVPAYEHLFGCQKRLAPNKSSRSVGDWITGNVNALIQMLKDGRLLLKDGTEFAAAGWCYGKLSTEANGLLRLQQTVRLPSQSVPIGGWPDGKKLMDGVRWQGSLNIESPAPAAAFDEPRDEGDSGGTFSTDLCFEAWRLELADTEMPAELAQFVLSGVKEGFRIRIRNVGCTVDNVEQESYGSICRALNDMFVGQRKLRFSSAAACGRRLRKGMYMFKVDLSQAYRSCGIHPSDHCLTGLKFTFEGDVEPTYMVDTRLPFGAAASVRSFFRVSNASRFMMLKRKFYNFEVYMDDFGFAGSLTDCWRFYTELTQLVQRLGLPGDRLPWRRTPAAAILCDPAVFDWCYLKWDVDAGGVFCECCINYKEAAAVLLALLRWRHQLHNCRVDAYCDNAAACAIVNNEYSREPRLLRLLQTVALLCLKQLNVGITAYYAPGRFQLFADAASHLHCHQELLNFVLRAYATCRLPGFLDDAAAKLLQQAYASSSKKSLSSAIRSWQRFCLERRLDPLCFRAKDLANYVARIVDARLRSFGSVCVHISGLSANFRLAGAPDLTKHPLLHLVLRGGAEPQAAMSPDILSRLRLQADCSSPVQAACWAAVMCAWWGMFRKSSLLPRCRAAAEFAVKVQG